MLPDSIFPKCIKGGFWKIPVAFHVARSFSQNFTRCAVLKSLGSSPKKKLHKSLPDTYLVRHAKNTMAKAFILAIIGKIGTAGGTGG